MKANEAPEKLYIDSREHWMKSWTAFTTKAKGNDIEYTRTDTFIEKACLWLEKNIAEVTGIDSYAITQSFKKAMEK